MKISNVNIGWRLGVGFSFVIVLALIAGIVSINTMHKLAGLTTDIYDHPLTVGNAVRDIRMNVTAMHRSMKDVALANNLNDINAAAAIVDVREKETIVLFNTVLDRFLGDKRIVKESLKEFTGWKVIRDEVIQLMIKGEKQEAVEITRGKGAMYVDHMQARINAMIDFATEKGNSFYENALDTKEKAVIFTLIIIGMIFLVSMIIATLITRSISVPINKMVEGVKDIANGNFETSLEITQTDEVGMLGNSINKMTDSLRNQTSEGKRRDWLKTGIVRLSDAMRGEKDVSTLSRDIVTSLAEYLNARIGAIFLADENRHLEIAGRYAYEKHEGIPDRFAFGEGLVGQAAVDGKIALISDVPDDYITIASGLGQTPPRNIVVLPFLFEGRVRGVIELGTLDEFSDLQMELLGQVAEGIAIAVNAARSRQQVGEMLEKTQEQTEELQTQQEELKTSNEELEEQTKQLQASEEELRTQQEELRVTNEELELQKNEVVGKNEALEKIKIDLEQKAQELAVTSRYKTEFLANMSHELRTPLNSLLILAQDLSANKENNLSDDQIEEASIIYSSGSDLLKLINEILDLSKVEAGKVTLNIERVELSDIADSIESSFKYQAEDKGLKFEVKTDKGLPASIKTDRQRIEQIIKNLMSNALKFTKKGGITVAFHRPDSDTDLSRSALAPENSIAVAVTDTGIGIPEDKRLEIFEAFQQVDGSISREYGGTGLGLSISRELARLLGGEIQLSSKEGYGSTFTLYIPVELKERPDAGTESRATETREVRQAVAVDTAARASDIEGPHIEDDRDNINEDDRVILVIEDDEDFAKVLLKFCHERGFKCLHAGDGRTGLEITHRYKPDAIILDIRLPDIRGWDVLEAIKNNSTVRHIPVHIMSVEEEPADILTRGAIGYLTKPVDRKQIEDAFSRIKAVISKKVKKLLIVEDDEVALKDLKMLLGGGDVETKGVSCGEDAIKELKSAPYDGMILDLNLLGISGFDVLERLDELNIRIPPVIIYTGRDLTRDEENRLQEYASSIIVKGEHSSERLLDETALFLHRVVEDMPVKKKKIIKHLYDDDPVFRDKKILLADDDMRNVFAISKVLSDRGINVVKAVNGQKALEILDKEPDIDLVLMDIMMPVMDGYEAIRRIRSQKRFSELPVIALTAKAMSKDRDMCISAGANDYMAKPVDIERLLSTIRVWLHKK